MGRRTLAARSLEFHRRRRPDESFAPADLGGVDLLDAFEAWCGDLQPHELHDPANNLWVLVRDVGRDGRNLLASVEVGSYGEAGSVVDADSGDVLMSLSENQAPTGLTRAVLHVPPHGETALFFIEYSGRGSGGSRLLRAFASHWANTSDFTMVDRAVTEAEAWVEAAELREVEVRVREASSDIADPANETKGIFSHVLRAPRNKVLRRDLLQDLRAHPHRAAKTVGLSEMPEHSEVLVTLRNREGRQKKFVLGEVDGLPAMREELNGPGEPKLSDARLLGVCADKTSDLLARM